MTIKNILIIFLFAVAFLYFTRNIKDSWFGSWKCLLVGELSNDENLDLVHKKLVQDLRDCKLDVNETLLRVILGGSNNDCTQDKWVSQLSRQVKKGTYSSLKPKVVMLRKYVYVMKQT